MERASLLSALSPQLKALVEASLGEVLPDTSLNVIARPSAGVGAGRSPGSAAAASETHEDEEKASASMGSASGANNSANASTATSHSHVTKLSPSELFGGRDTDFVLV